MDPLAKCRASLEPCGVCNEGGLEGAGELCAVDTAEMACTAEETGCWSPTPWSLDEVLSEVVEPDLKVLKEAALPADGPA